MAKQLQMFRKRRNFAVLRAIAHAAETEGYKTDEAFQIAQGFYSNHRQHLTEPAADTAQPVLDGVQ